MTRLLFLLLLLPLLGTSQSYTSYLTGNPADTAAIPQGGVCLMGGASEDDNAMRWFLQRAGGGDILVLRTSGSDGYNDYLYNLGVDVHSVETIVCNSAAASYNPYVQQKINGAEAIWFAGGDQWDYVSYWRNTPVDSLINLAIHDRHIVVGGTSAGMAILGSYYFSARYGTVTSSSALLNPYNSHVTVDSAAFLHCNDLSGVITDTHFDNPDRKGRLVAFLARIALDFGQFARGIACDEYTAVCIDSAGIARVYGGYPTYDDNAYFIQSNCKLTSMAPEVCTASTPLTWNLGGEALKVYAVKGNPGGTRNFNLNDWKSGSGGSWMNWFADSGVFGEQPGAAIDCGASAVPETPADSPLVVVPNPVPESACLQSAGHDLTRCRITLTNTLGQSTPWEVRVITASKAELLPGSAVPGFYLISVEGEGKAPSRCLILKK